MPLKLLFLDIETTGLDPEKAELIELSAVRISADFRKNTAQFDELVLPEELKIPPFVQNITGITPKLLEENGEKIDIVRADFTKFLKKDDIICGHNIAFDIGFLRHHGFEIPNDSLDTFPLANLLLPDEPSFALEALTAKYEIEHRNAHRALADVEANIELLRILFEKAREMSPELATKFSRILEKSKWSGKAFFKKAFSKLKKPEKENPQGSLFDAIVPDKEIIVPKSLPEANPKITNEITEFFRESSAMIQIPLEKNPRSCAFAAARKTENVAVVTHDFSNIPTDFTPFAAPENIFCPRAFEKWFSPKPEISLEETIAALKTFAAEHRGVPMILADLPLFRTENDIARIWSSADHSRCDKNCPAQQIALSAQKQTHFACRLEDVAVCPASKLLVLDSANLSEEIDRISREFLSLKNLEIALSRKEKDDPHFVESAFFGIGLLKKLVRDTVGESRYSKHLLTDSAFFTQKEVENLRAGFREASEMLPDFAKLSDFLEEKSDDIRLQITISGNDDLFLNRTRVDLTPVFDQIFGAKSSVIFLDSRFLKKGGRFFFGSGISAPNAQKEFPSHFSEKAFFAVPSFGGNTKMDGAEKTAEFVAEICKGAHSYATNKNLLILFPSAKLLENFIPLIENSARESGFEIVIANGSAGKIAAKMASGEQQLVLSTNGNLGKINFSQANFAACIQHRLFFEPPADPLFRLRNADSDDFLDIALPRAIRHFLRVLDGFFAAGKSFAWICLDAHFQKIGNFTDEFLAHFPNEIPVVRGNANEILKGIQRFYLQNK